MPTVRRDDATYSTGFVVMPKDCNYLGDMIFGGALLAQMDIAAAVAVRRAMYNCTHKKAVTVGVNRVQFLVAALIGDLVTLKAEVIRLGIRSITVYVEGHRERIGTGVSEKICSGEFVFCNIDEQRQPVKHELEWTDGSSR